MGTGAYVRIVEELPVKPVMKPRAWAATLSDYVERAILWYFDDSSSKKPNYYLKGNYAPADETDPVCNLPVVGTIPVSAFVMDSCLATLGPCACVQSSYFCAFYHLGNALECT